MNGNPIKAKEYNCYPHSDVKERLDWDIAICRYKIRTNSGASGDGKGGIYVFPKDKKFDDIDVLPSSAVFTEDAREGGREMSGNHKYEPRCKEQITILSGMPPTYLDVPQYAFRSADGNTVYLVDFISYQNAEGVTGYVNFKYKEIGK